MKPLYVKKNGVVYKISGTGIPSIYPAENVEYDNTVTSELQATDVQGAIDELSTRQGGVQSDWNENDSTELDYIKNKPQNLVQDANYVHTDNNYDNTAKNAVNALGTASTKDVGVANGVAELDAAGKVPSSQLPSFVDDVIEVADYDHLPITGESGKIYVTLDTNKTYRWAGSGYAEISESLALGETSSTAYRGDRGKANADAITALQTTVSNKVDKSGDTMSGALTLENSGIVEYNNTKAITGGTVYNQALRFKDLSSRQDYTRIVIGLCEISASASQGSANCFSGRVMALRSNALYNTKIADITIQDGYSVAKSCTYSLMSNFENTSTAAITGDGYRVCTFTYNSKNYAGLEFYITSSCSIYVMGNWTPAFTPFKVIYYTQSSTPTINNEEIYNSINFSATNNIRYNLTVDKAKDSDKVNGLTVQTAVPANAVFTDTKYNFSGGTFYSGNSNTAEHNANNIQYNGLYYYNSNGPGTDIGATTADGAIYAQAHTTSWVGQIAQDYRDGDLFVRGKNSGTLQQWKKILCYEDAAGFIYTPVTNFKFEPLQRKIITVKSTSAWDSQVYSRHGYTDNVYVTFKPAQTNMAIMIGLDSNPAQDVGHANIDYCWYVFNTGIAGIYESGTSIQNYGSYAVGDEFRIEYSGGKVRYYMNGALKREVARAYDKSKKLYMDSSMHGSSSTLYDVDFGQFAYAANKVDKSGDSMSGTLCINSASTGSFTEGLRINAGNGGYSTLLIGGTANSTSGTSAGAFWIGTNTTNASYKRKLYIGQNGSTQSTTYFYTNADATVTPSLQIGGDLTVNGSTNAGNACVASGTNSHAEGYQTRASGQYSHAEGQSTTASGAEGSHAEGNGTSASGTNSHAEGYQTVASGNSSHAEGVFTTAVYNDCHAEGRQTCAYGNHSHAEGYYATASGQCSHAEGYKTLASGSYSHAEGELTQAPAQYSYAGGSQTIASGTYSHTEGHKTTTSGIGSHAEGGLVSAGGNYSHAEGESTQASGGHSHAEGYISLASGAHSHAEGQQTAASGENSHAEGYQTVASNYASHSSGHHNAAMTTGGNYNNTTGTAFVIGNGTATNALKNAFSVQFNGVVKAASTITASTTADYAEYFEWTDENPNNEDRVGYFVTFDDGDKIRFATSEDDYILGVTSGEPFVLGNGDCDVWNGMVLRDEFRRIIYEPAPEMIDVAGGGHIPKMDKDGNPVYNGTRPKLNPNYDPSKPYINRADRPEWCPVGMLGVLAVRDDGTCEVNGYATITDNAIATKYTGQNQNKYRVIKRNTENVVEIVFR